MFTDYSCFFSLTCFWQHTLTFAIGCGDDKLILWLLLTIINMTGRTRVKNWDNRLPYSRKSKIKDWTLDTIPWNKTVSSTSQWEKNFKDSQWQKSHQYHHDNWITIWAPWCPVRKREWLKKCLTHRAPINIFAQFTWEYNHWYFAKHSCLLLWNRKTQPSSINE